MVKQNTSTREIKTQLYVNGEIRICLAVMIRAIIDDYFILTWLAGINFPTMFYVKPQGMTKAINNVDSVS
jgi:hypothetical protein